MHKIEKEGFEMYGFKLGQITNEGVIIAFDKYKNAYTVGEYLVNCKFLIDSDDVLFILKGFEFKPYDKHKICNLKLKED